MWKTNINHKNNHWWKTLCFDQNIAWLIINRLPQNFYIWNNSLGKWHPTCKARIYWKWLVKGKMRSCLFMTLSSHIYNLTWYSWTEMTLDFRCALFTSLLCLRAPNLANLVNIEHLPSNCKSTVSLSHFLTCEHTHCLPLVL